MAELKTKVNDDDVAAFIDAVPDPEKRRDAQTVLAMMAKITRRPAKMWGSSIVGFGSYHYRYASGREGDMMITGFSPRRNALTLYIMPGFSRCAALMEKLGKYKTGKSCLYVKRLEDIDQKVLAQLIRASVAHMRKTYPTT
jgi:hypothetical protein